MKKFCFLCIVLLFTTIVKSQHAPGAFTIDNLNQLDSSGRKQGYWEVYVDSTFRDVDSTKHDFCLINYWYNDRTFEWMVSLKENERFKINYDLKVDSVNGKKLVSGRVEGKFKSKNGFRGWVFIIENGILKERKLIDEFKNYYESYRFDKKIPGNDASCYLNAIYYGDKHVTGFFEMVGKGKKRVKHLEKKRIDDTAYLRQCIKEFKEN